MYTISLIQLQPPPSSNTMQTTITSIVCVWGYKICHVALKLYTRVECVQFQRTVE